MLGDLERKGEAIEMYWRALLAEPDHFPSLHNLGGCLTSGGPVMRAMAEWLLWRAVALRPDSAAALGALLHLTMIRSHVDCAKEPDGTPRGGAGYTESIHRLREAASLSRHILELDPGDARASGMLEAAEKITGTEKSQTKLAALGAAAAAVLEEMGGRKVRRRRAGDEQRVLEYSSSSSRWREVREGIDGDGKYYAYRSNV